MVYRKLIMSAINNEIKTEPQSTCVVCGSDGIIKYENITDRLFGATGKWTLRECNAVNCGALWLDPRPTPEDIAKVYSNYYTHGGVDEQRTFIKRTVRALAHEVAASKYGFSSSHLPWPGKHLASFAAALYPGLKEHLELLIRYLPASSLGNGMLLDIGCGDGEALEILRDLGWQVCGVEIDEQAAVAARKRGIEVHQGTMVDAAFPEGSFDAVTSSHVIEHVHDPRAFLIESLRVLRPGGKLVVVTPNMRSRSHLQHGINWRGLEPPRHLVIFSVESLRNLAQAVGLRNISVTTTVRAVALSEIAGIKVKMDSHYLEGKWPGASIWMRAQTKQIFESLTKRDGDDSGNEIVLTATR